MPCTAGRQASRSVGHHEGRRSEAHLVTGPYRDRAGDPPAVQPGAVGRAEIRQQPAIVTAIKPRVPPGYGLVGQGHVTCRLAADSEPSPSLPRQQQGGWRGAHPAVGHGHGRATKIPQPLARRLGQPQPPRRQVSKLLGELIAAAGPQHGVDPVHQGVLAEAPFGEALMQLGDCLIALGVRGTQRMRGCGSSPWPEGSHSRKYWPHGGGAQDWRAACLNYAAWSDAAAATCRLSRGRRLVGSLQREVTGSDMVRPE